MEDGGSCETPTDTNDINEYTFEEGSLDKSWIPPFFHAISTDEANITGWVESEADLQTLLEIHRRFTLCTFVYLHDDRKTKAKTGRRLFWDNDYGIPYAVFGTVIKQCQYGKKHKRSTDSKPAGKSLDHSYQRKRRQSLQPTRKVGCLAKVTIRYIERYSTYAVDPAATSRDEKEDKLVSLKEALSSDNPPNSDTRIFVSLPLPQAHSEHSVTVESGFSNRLHSSVIGKIEELVECGVVSVPYVRKALRHFVQKELCKGDTVKPQSHDRAYYPTRGDIRNHISKFLLSGRFSLLDQENLEKKIDIWKQDNMSSCFFYRPCQEKRQESVKITAKEDKGFRTEDEDDEDEDDVPTQSDFLVVHQETWQQSLLIKYGNTLSLLDATYKTTKYSMPLFLLCVRTNVGYLPVAEFICQYETHGHIEEALTIIKEWNPDWKPAYFMTDYSEAEYLSIKSVFPSTEVYLCAFHREQAWERWSKDGKNGLNAEQRDDFLQKMRAIAHAKSEKEYQKSVQCLKTTTWYQKNPKARIYIENKWLSVSKRWCAAYSKPGFQASVTTNNGVESLNKSLKTFYLRLSGTGTVSTTVDLLVHEFVPDMLHSYCLTNYRQSSEYKAYSSAVPPFLQNKPRALQLHCLRRMSSAALISVDKIIEEETGNFKVEDYTVSLGNETQYPYCTCPDFGKYFMPCKHFFAVFNTKKCSWYDMSGLYINSPYTNLDTDFMSTTVAVELIGKIEANKALEEELAIGEPDACDPDPPAPTEASKRRLRALLKEVETASFLCEDEDAIEKARTQLESTRDMLLLSAKTENGLLLEQLPKKPNSFKPLPLKRKRRLSLVDRHKKRVGQKAGEIKKASVITVPLVKKVNTVKEGDRTQDLLEGNTFEGPTPIKRRKIPKEPLKSRTVGGVLKTKKHQKKDGERTEVVLLQMLEDALQGMQEADWKQMISSAKTSSNVSCDIVERTANEILDQYCPMEAQVDILIRLSRRAPSDMTEPQKLRLSHLILFTLVKNGKISIKRDFVKEEKETSDAVDALLKTVRELNSDSSKSNQNSSAASKTRSKRVTLKVHPTLTPPVTRTTGSILKSRSNSYSGLVQEFERELDMVNSTELAISLKKDTRYYVLGETIEFVDLISTDNNNYLNDKIMNAFLLNLMDHQNKGQCGHIYVITSYLPVLWSQGRFDHYLYRKVKMSLFDWIFLPINVAGYHWVLLVANVAEQSVSILDSMGHANRALVQKWRKFMKLRSQVTGELAEWSEGHLKSSKQTDGHSCGPFVLMNAMAIVRGIDPEELNQAIAKKLRQYAKVKLLQSAKEPLEQRTMCDMVGCQKPGPQKPSACCKICGHWCHFVCVNLQKPNRNFVCPVCVAKYE